SRFLLYRHLSLSALFPYTTLFRSKVFVDPETGLTTDEAAELARGIGIPDGSVAAAAAEFQRLYKVYWDTDASLAEINPLIVTGRSEEHTSELQSRFDLVCRLLLEK